MIAISNATFEDVMQALLDSRDPQAIKAIGLMRDARLESLAREEEFNNEAPALCRSQAG